MNTIPEYKQLFYALLSTPLEFEDSAHSLLSVQRVEQSISILTALVRLNIINLHPNESLTSFIIFQVLRGLGWNNAVETWMNFQSAFHCANGMIELLRHAIRIHDEAKIVFVMHKARAVVSENRAKAFLAAAYILQQRPVQARLVLAKAQPPLGAWDVIPVFRMSSSWVIGRAVGTKRDAGGGRGASPLAVVLRVSIHVSRHVSAAHRPRQRRERATGVSRRVDSALR